MIIVGISRWFLREHLRIYVHIFTCHVHVIWIGCCCELLNDCDDSYVNYLVVESLCSSYLLCDVKVIIV